MDWVLIGELLLILALIAGNAFFVGSEIALTSARRSRINQLTSTGNKAAKIVQVLHNEPERFYSVTQIGITLVSLALGAIGMTTLTQIMDPSIEVAFSLFGNSEKIVGWAHTFSYIIAFIIISFLHVVAGELAPKVLAFHKAESISLAVARTINWLHAVMRPLIKVLEMDKHRITKVLFRSQETEVPAEKMESQTKDRKSRSWFASWSSKHKDQTEAQAAEGGRKKNRKSVRRKERRGWRKKPISKDHRGKVISVQGRSEKMRKENRAHPETDDRDQTTYRLLWQRAGQRCAGIATGRGCRHHQDCMQRFP